MDLNKETYYVKEDPKLAMKWCKNLFYALEPNVDLFVRVHEELGRKAGYTLCYKGVGAIIGEQSAEELVCFDDETPFVVEDVRCFDSRQANVYVSSFGGGRYFITKIEVKTGASRDDIPTLLNLEVVQVPTKETYSKARMEGVS